MQWVDIRQAYPHQWLLVEAIEAHSQQEERILDRIAVVDTFPDSQAAMQSYLTLHRHSPERELYVLHTDREALRIEERSWLGVRGAP
jgi:hypothetical protein